MEGLEAGIHELVNDKFLLTYLIVCQCLNYTSFLATFANFIIIYFPVRYLELLKDVETLKNPYTGESLKDDKNLFNSMLASDYMMVLFCILMHYLVQKNLLYMSMMKNIKSR